MHYSYEILQKYIENITKHEEQKIQFFLLNNITSKQQIEQIQEIIRHTLKDYYLSDFLHLKDFSLELGKKHNIRIQEERHSEVHKKLLTEQNYQDIGVREINTRLQQSGFGNIKILLIENIERMTGGAINAFLKTAEEPLRNKIILASTSNKTNIIDTICSRAITINFQGNHNDINTSIQNHQYISQTPELQKNIMKLQLRNSEDIEKISQLSQSDKHAKTMLSNLPKLLSSSENIKIKVEFLKKLHTQGLLTSIIDGIIAIYTQEGQFQLANRWLDVKKLMQSNVNLENILFYGFVNL